MKKTVFVLILILGMVYGVFCQNSGTEIQGSMDLVVLLDTSASMSSSYRETSEYLIGPFLKEFLRIGDTFHLVSFSGTPKVEISRRIEAVGDVEAIIGRILLMYPLDNLSDIAGALSFAENYCSSLPGNRYRKIILITDGDAPGTQSQFDSSSSRFRNQNRDMQYIRVPVTGNGPSSGRVEATVIQQPVAQTPPPIPADTQVSTAPVQSGSGSTRSEEPPVVSSSTGAVSATGTPETTSQEITPGISQGTTQGTTSQGATQETTSQETTQGATAQGASSETPSGSTQGTQSTGETAPPTVSQPPAAQSGTSSAAQTREPIFSGDIPLPLLIALIILLLLILGLIIFFVARRLHSSPNRVMAQAAAPMDARDRVEADRQAHIKDAELMDSYAKSKSNQRKPLPKDQVYETQAVENGGPIMLNLFVEDQNTAIGRRNIHILKSGYTYSVGGGKSDFLIFLVPLPPHIADIQMSSNNCTFIPRKPQYFPDIGSQAVSACIGKTIRVISDKNYELHIRMERYEDPLIKLNKMLHSISVPGEVK